MNLFEHYTEQPPELQKICNHWAEIQATDGLTYKDCKKFLDQVQEIGYTFDYELSAEPYNLRKK